MIDEKQLYNLQDFIRHNNDIEDMVNKVPFDTFYDDINELIKYASKSNELELFGEDRKKSILSTMKYVIGTVEKIYTIKEKVCGIDWRVTSKSDQVGKILEGNFLGQTHSVLVELPTYFKNQICRGFNWTDVEYYDKIIPYRVEDGFKLPELTRNQNETVYYLITEFARILPLWGKDRLNELIPPNK